MKKYGQTDVMCAIIHAFIERQDRLTDEQKKKIEIRCSAEIAAKYPAAVEWDVEKNKPYEYFS